MTSAIVTRRPSSSPTFNSTCLAFHSISRPRAASVVLLRPLADWRSFAMYARLLALSAKRFGPTRVKIPSWTYVSTVLTLMSHHCAKSRGIARQGLDRRSRHWLSDRPRPARGCARRRRCLIRHPPDPPKFFLCKDWNGEVARPSFAHKSPGRTPSFCGKGLVGSAPIAHGRGDGLHSRRPCCSTCRGGAEQGGAGGALRGAPPPPS
jgi:hypothetical protein